MSYKRTDRTSIKGVLVLEEDSGNTFIHLEDEGEVVALDDVMEDYLNEEVRLTVVLEKKPLE